jgi:hypothetical protein
MAGRLPFRPVTVADPAAIDAGLARSYPRLQAPDCPPSLRGLALALMSRARLVLLAFAPHGLARGMQGRIVGAGGWPGSSSPVRVGSGRGSAGP